MENGETGLEHVCLKQGLELWGGSEAPLKQENCALCLVVSLVLLSF